MQASNSYEFKFNYSNDNNNSNGVLRVKSSLCQMLSRGDSLQAEISDDQKCSNFVRFCIKSMLKYQFDLK